MYAAVYVCDATWVLGNFETTQNFSVLLHCTSKAVALVESVSRTGEEKQQLKTKTLICFSRYKAMTGMKRKLTSAKTANDPNSRINKSLRAWECN